MTLQRYKSNGHYSDGTCDHGEWVKASEAEAEIAALLKQIEVANLRLGILKTENETLKIDLSVQHGRGDALDKEIQKLRMALYCIRVNSYYCNSCSATMWAEDALEVGK